MQSQIEYINTKIIIMNNLIKQINLSNEQRALLTKLKQHYLQLYETIKLMNKQPKYSWLNPNGKQNINNEIDKTILILNIDKEKLSQAQKKKIIQNILEEIKIKLTLLQRFYSQN